MKRPEDQQGHHVFKETGSQDSRKGKTCARLERQGSQSTRGPEATLGIVIFPPWMTVIASNLISLILLNPFSIQQAERLFQIGLLMASCSHYHQSQSHMAVGSARLVRQETDRSKPLGRFVFKRWIIYLRSCIRVLQIQNAQEIKFYKYKYTYLYIYRYRKIFSKIYKRLT